MNKLQKEYQSVLGPSIKQFLAYKRALHKKYIGQESVLRALDLFLLNRSVKSLEEVDAELLNEFFLSFRAGKARTFNGRLSIVRLLFEWMVNQDIHSVSPVRTKRQRETPALTPFVFKHEDVNSLLVQAGQLRDAPNTHRRAETWRMMIMLGYGLGLRIGEISRLTLGDIDFDGAVLLIANTKFSKTRFVPMGPRLTQHLNTFVSESALTHKSDRVFRWCIAERRRQICGTSIVFRELTTKANLRAGPGQREPTFHDLRRSFAVNSLLRSYIEGKDPAAQLLPLSTFLGHSSIAHTAVYLTITNELLNKANERFHTFALSSLEEVAK